jgi:regulator of protease activity HflC (stomatin/prohibitin superfamily)
MLLLKYVLVTLASGMFLAAGAILANDLYRLTRLRFQPVPLEGAVASARAVRVRWSAAARLGLLAWLPLLLGLSIVVVPTGFAGVRLSQVSGTLPGTLYPGTHFVVPLVQEVRTYSVREHVYTTRASDKEKQPDESLKLQSKEGLPIGLGISVRYRIDPQRLPYVHANLPQPIETEIVPPVVASVFRETVPNYMVREVFSTKREEVRRTAAEAITRKLASDGILVKEVMVRDIALPPEYAKGLEGLLLKDQESERLAIEIEVKQKEVRTAELEAEAEKVRQVKAAEAQAQVVVLQAKAQADAMQHTLPLKEKQIQQTRLEAEARKEATVKNAEAMAQAKVIDSHAEQERLGLMAKAEELRIRLIAGADAEKLRTEAQVLKENPLLIQKIIAERLSDKVQIMMVPMDGKFFFANDVLKGTQVGMMPSRQER